MIWRGTGKNASLKRKRTQRPVKKRRTIDVASLLRLEAEVLLREDYLDNANLFKENVDQARLKESWSEHQEELDMYSNY